MKRLALMIGIAGCGKSTFVDKYLTKRNQVLCLDDIRLALGSVWDPKTEPVVYMVVDVQARALMERGLPIVIDSTCCQINIAKKWKRLADEYGYDLVGVHINTNFVTCMTRRDGQIPSDKMMQMDNDLADLLEIKDELFDKFITINDKGNINV
jgi:predicted kinase